MDRFRKFISCEDEMEVDLDFTERYLSQFESIDRQSIDVLIENGYQTKDQLLAFDIQEDLPMLPVLNMAQKSLLRKVLKKLYEDEELEVKIYDMIGDDTLSPNVSIIDTIPVPNKRKRDSTVVSPTKRLRSSPEKPVVSNDGLGTKMRQMVNKRKPIRRSSSQTEESDNETDYSTTVDPKRFQFAKNSQMNGFTLNSKNTRNGYNDEEEEEEFDGIQTKRLRSMPSKQVGGRPQTMVQNLRGRSTHTYSRQEEEEEEEEEVKPELTETRSLRGRRSIAPIPPSPARSLIPRKSMAIKSTDRKSIGSPLMRVKSEAQTTPKSVGKTSSPSAHIPTPTELEVRERLAQKKALAQQKGGRKRR